MINLSPYELEEKVINPLQDEFDRLIRANSDFICSDCIQTIQFIIDILDELGEDTTEHKKEFNQEIANWY